MRWVAVAATALLVACAPAAPDVEQPPVITSADIAAVRDAVVVLEGEPDTLAVTGTPSLVELFATWCTRCLEQLDVLDAVAVELGAEVRVLAVTAETLDAAALAALAEERGWTALQLGTVPPATVDALTLVFGPEVTNPPSLARFRVTSDGALSGLLTGERSADELIDLFRP